MENKNERNPFISGGILINNGDYFQKDNVNMENKDSLKASLALVNKIRLQKKAEIENSTNTYLKEESVAEAPRPEVTVFDQPKEDVTKPSIQTQPTYSTFEQTTNDTTFTENGATTDTSIQNQSAGITLADLDLDNRESLTEKKDEYLPDYRLETPSNNQPIDEIKWSDQKTEAIESPYTNWQNNTDSSQQNEPFNQNETSFDNNAFENNQSDYMSQSLNIENQKPLYVITDNDSKKGKQNKYAHATASNEEVKAGRGVAWLAYILFFIPLLFKRNNPFVRWHANEGLELFLLDILGVAFFLAGYLLESTKVLISTLLFLSLVLGSVIIILSLITKIFMIIFCLAGKEARNPWGLTKLRIIK